MMIPMAVLFENGTAFYGNSKGSQIPKMQKYGWSGLHLFLKKYPKGRLHIGSCARPCDDECVKTILKYIKKPDEIE